jgi:hypothetical protein
MFLYVAMERSQVMRHVIRKVMKAVQSVKPVWIAHLVMMIAAMAHVILLTVKHVAVAQQIVERVLLYVVRMAVRMVKIV